MRHEHGCQPLLARCTVRKIIPEEGLPPEVTSGQVADDPVELRAKSSQTLWVWLCARSGCAFAPATRQLNLPRQKIRYLNFHQSIGWFRPPVQSRYCQHDGRNGICPGPGYSLIRLEGFKCSSPLPLGSVSTVCSRLSKNTSVKSSFAIKKQIHPSIYFHVPNAPSDPFRMNSLVRPSSRPPNQDCQTLTRSIILLVGCLRFEECTSLPPDATLDFAPRYRLL